MRVSIAITAPFDVGDLAAQIQLENGELQFVVLRDGQLQADFPSRAVRVTLTDSPSQGEKPLRLPDYSRSGTPKGEAIDLHICLAKATISLSMAA